LKHGKENGHDQIRAELITGRKRTQEGHSWTHLKIQEVGIKPQGLKYDTICQIHKKGTR